ncbi:MAG TPA: type IV pilus twitching motility protein PilT [Actinomycetota bacterium]|nr:type IV pilus twitching motility protein PilT [Actinomycetota bacterium]
MNEIKDAPPPPPQIPTAQSPPPASVVDPEPAVVEEMIVQPAPEAELARSDESGPLDSSVSLPPFQGEPGRVHIDDFLRYIVDVKASDLHVKVGSPPTIRISGDLHPLDYPVLESDETHSLTMAMVGDKERSTLETNGEADFAYSLSGVGRFRVNVHRQRGTLGIAARRILPGAPDFADLKLPPVVETLANEHRGLLLVTGPTSSGKTTTCGAIIKHINQTRRCHIVTIEDPIEILHKDEMSVVTQREVGQDTNGFHPALRAAMRQDPDVIFVGEIRDTETVGAALQAAETGHFVVATLHTTNVPETINRIIDFFPPEQQNQVRITLAGSLAGVVTQRLLPRIGGGRAPALEVMVMNGRIQDCILDPNKTHGMHDIMAESGFYGMQTFDQALINLYRAGSVTFEDALSAANVPHDFELKLKTEGLLT